MAGIKYRISKICKSDYTIVIIFDLIAKLLMGLTSILFIRTLSNEDYAILTKFQSLSSLFLSIVGTGLSVAYVRFAAEQVSRGDNSYNLYKKCFVIILIGLLIAFIFSPVISCGYRMSLEIVLLSLLYGVFLSINKMIQSFFQVNGKYSFSGILLNVKNVITCFLFLLIGIYLNKNSIYVVLNCMLIGCLVSCILGGVWTQILAHKLNINLKTIMPSNSLFKELMHESLWLIIYYMLTAFFYEAGIFIMSQFATDNVVAIYGVANKYYGLIMTLLSSFTTVLRIKTSNKEMIDFPEKRIHLNSR